jgi:hypothetical protein
MADAQSRIELILENILGATNPLEPQNRIEALLQEILAQGGGGAGPSFDKNGRLHAPLLPRAHGPHRRFEHM